MPTNKSAFFPGEHYLFRSFFLICYTFNFRTFLLVVVRLLLRYTPFFGRNMVMATLATISDKVVDT